MVGALEKIKGIRYNLFWICRGEQCSPCTPICYYEEN